MAEIAKKLRYLLTIIAGTILGICIGAALMNALVSYRVDAYYKEIQYLNTVIENKDVRLEKLQASINKNRLVLSDVKIYLEYKVENNANGTKDSDGLDKQTDKELMDEFDKILLETTIRDKYKKLIGREVTDIDTSILGDIIHNRIMKTDNAEYKLYVSQIVLSDILEIWVMVEKLE